LRRQEADDRQQQQARVESLAAVALDEAAELGVEAVPANLRVNFVSHRAPALDRAFLAELLHRLHRAIERHPGHHLRISEVAARPAHLPDPFVGLPPDLLEMAK